jgi:hypothetical protein
MENNRPNLNFFSNFQWHFQYKNPLYPKKRFFSELSVTPLHMYSFYESLLSLFITTGYSFHKNQKKETLFLA